MDIKKPTPRRLYSSDSNKSSTSSTEYNLPRGPRPMSRVVSVDEEDEKDRNRLGPIPETKEHWIVAEPTSLLDHAVACPPVTQELQSKLEPVRQSFLEHIRSSTPTNSSATATTVPSSLWDNLRHHVLPSSVRPSTPTQQGSRSGTPKPSRFAKSSSFKQVVDDARSVNADTRRFGEEILRACGVARYGEVMPTPTRESLINTATSGGAAGGWKLDYLRRPHSIASVPSSSQTASPPSFRYLYQILVSYSEGSNRRQFFHFPHEDRLLSTLLSPFLFPTPYPVLRLDEEQVTAVDAFELLSRSWPPTDEVCLCDLPLLFTCISNHFRRNSLL